MLTAVVLSVARVRCVLVMQVTSEIVAVKKFKECEGMASLGTYLVLFASVAVSDEKVQFAISPSLGVTLLSFTIISCIYV